MKYLLIVFGALTWLAAMAPTDANAIVCARGVVRAGCAGPNGAVVVRRPPPRGVVVVPAGRGCTVVRGRRVCR